MEKAADFNWGETVMEKEAKRAETIAMVREMFPDVDFPTPVMEPIYFGRFEKKSVDNRKLMLDRNTGTQYDIVSDDYQLIHHEEVVDMVLKACPVEFGKPEFKIKMLLNGARSVVQAQFPDMGDFKVEGSPINPIIRMMNSVNRSTHLVYSYGAEELVCTNGLIRYVEKDKSKFRHITGSLNALDLQEQITSDLTGFSTQYLVWQHWAQRQLDKLQVDEIIEKLPFSEAEQAKLLELPLVNHRGETLAAYVKAEKATLWTVNSAATQFTRTIKSEHRAFDIESAIGATLEKYN